MDPDQTKTNFGTPLPKTYLKASSKFAGLYIQSVHFQIVSFAIRSFAIRPSWFVGGELRENETPHVN